MPLSFLASIAENESRIRSRSMEVSLAQRLNGGLPLTPKLLGYSHDTDGKLVINPDEAPTVKLIFYMYLSGYSSSHIAKTLEALADRFGSDFYSHRLTSSSPELQSEDAWKLWLEGQLFETGEKLQVTKFDEMQRFIAEQLAPIKQKEEVDFNA